MSRTSPHERVHDRIGRPREAPPSPRSHRHRRPLPARIALRVLLVLAALIVVVVIASFFVDEPVRRSIEGGMNRALKDYTVRLPAAHFQLIGGSVTLHDLEIRQKAHPDPAVLVVPRLKASVQWGELLTLHLVADFFFDRPVLYMNLPQLREETQNNVPVKERGWQQALEAIYPLKINLLRIQEGSVTYLDEDPSRPLKLTHLNLRAGNIRNIHSKKRVYPSTVQAEAVIFESGRATVNGHADFLAEPFPGIQAQFQLARVPLDSVRPVAARSNLQIKGGLLNATGEMEYAPSVQRVHLTDVTIQGVRLDLVHAAAQAASTQKAAPANAATPPTDLSLDRFRLLDCDLGLINKTKSPAYRVFVSGVNLDVSGLSNVAARGPGHATFRGKFMGAGATDASATFRADEKKNLDLAVKLEIKDTPLTTLNDLLRAHGRFDVAGGVFSLYSEITVKNQEINGTVKPLFRDVQVYDARQEAGKSVVQKLYEGVVNVVAKLLENRQRKEVATVFELHGRVDSPNSSVWQILGGLLENAFIKAILPGFDMQTARGLVKTAK